MRHITIAACALLAACGSKTETGNAAGANAQGGNTQTAAQTGAAQAGAQTSSFDAGFRSTYRPKFISSCTSGAQAAAARSGNRNATPATFETLCGCAADKLLATKTVAELMRGPTAADQASVTQACLREHPLTPG